MSDPDRLDAALADQVLERLGFGAPPSLDVDGLTDLYAAWRRRVPFDNVRKLIALHRPEPGPLPGLDVDDFFRSWLDHGVGGTCWPSSWALWSLVADCGFSARPIAASMFDAGIPSHGTTIVTIDGEEWLIDSSMLYGRPLRLDPTGPTSIDEPVWSATARPVAEGWLFGFPRGDQAGHIPCRTITPAGVPHDLYAERYEWSRHNSPFNEQVSVRRNRGDTMLSYGGGASLVRSATGVDITDLTGRRLRAGLITDMGFSVAIVDQLFAAVDLS